MCSVGGAGGGAGGRCDGVTGDIDVTGYVRAPVEARDRITMARRPATLIGTVIEPCHAPGETSTKAET